MIEANLGIICTCLPVLKQLVKRLFPSMFSLSKASPVGNYGYGYGGSGSGGPDHANGSTKQDRSTHSNRQHYNLDDTVDDEDTHTDAHVHGRNTSGKGVWAGGKSYPMTPLSHQSASDNGRESDEKHIMPARGTERDPSQSSAERVDMITGWPLN